LRRAASGTLGAAEGQLQRLVGLGRAVGQASAASLLSIRSEVVASVAEAQAVVQQIRSSGATSASAITLRAANDNARREVESFVGDYYGRRIFDPYLRFSSPEEEEAFRKREAERQAAIRKAEADGTPTGTLRALNLSIDQLDDAGRHGATESPDFARRRERLVRGRDDLERARTADPLAALSADGKLAPETLAAFQSNVTGGDDLSTGHGVSLDAREGIVRGQG